MNFEDQLKTLTQSAKQKEMEEGIELKKRQILYQQQQQLLLDIKALIENEFESLKKYFPNATIHPTHTVEYGKIVPNMGTFNCCFLQFSPNVNYEITVPALIGFCIDIDENLNIKLCDTILNLNIPHTNEYSLALNGFRTKKFIDDYYFEGSFDKNDIIEKTQAKLLEDIASIKLMA